MAGHQDFSIFRDEEIGEIALITCAIIVIRDMKWWKEDNSIQKVSYLRCMNPMCALTIDILTKFTTVRKDEVCFLPPHEKTTDTHLETPSKVIYLKLLYLVGQTTNKHNQNMKVYNFTQARVPTGHRRCNSCITGFQGYRYACYFRFTPLKRVGGCYGRVPCTLERTPQYS